jgi:hypothetical protein
MYDVDDEDGSRENSTPHHVCDMYDDASMIATKDDKDWEICVDDENQGVDLGDESR